MKRNLPVDCFEREESGIPFHKGLVNPIVSVNLPLAYGSDLQGLVAKVAAGIDPINGKPFSTVRANKLRLFHCNQRM